MLPDRQLRGGAAAVGRFRQEADLDTVAAYAHFVGAIDSLSRSVTDAMFALL